MSVSLHGVYTLSQNDIKLDVEKGFKTPISYKQTVMTAISEYKRKVPWVKGNHFYKDLLPNNNYKHFSMASIKI